MESKTVAARVVDFSKFEGPVYSGRQRGELVRREQELDFYDKDAGLAVEVKVPPNTYSVTSSFFLGMFGPSIVKAGNREAFFAKYHFEAPASLLERFNSFVSRALEERALFKSRG